MNIWKWEEGFLIDSAMSNFGSETSRMGAELENNWENNNNNNKMWNSGKLKST